MIQRKQTALLTIATISLLQLFLFPVYSFEKEGQQTLLYIYGFSTINSDFLLLILLNVFNILLLLVIIFLYKKRTLQMKLCKLSTLLIAGLIVAIFYVAENIKSYQEFTGYTSDIRPAMVAPLAALVLVILANRFINKDEELVRSADRLR